MATPRASEYRDLEQRLRDLETQVQRLTSMALRRDQLKVSSGDFVVSGGGNIIIQDDAGDTVWDALSGPLTSRQVFAENNSMTVSNNWTTYGSRTRSVPDGYTSCMAIMSASVGGTMGDEFSNVSVQPFINGTPGPAINSGNGSVVVATSVFSTEFDITPGQTDVELHLSAVRSGPMNTGTGNWHLSALLLFQR